jgi:hypothetical protein
MANFSVEWTANLLRILEVPSSTDRPEASYSELVYRGFIESLL